MSELPQIAQVVYDYSSSDDDTEEESNFLLGHGSVQSSQHDTTMFNIEFEPSGR